MVKKLISTPLYPFFRYNFPVLKNGYAALNYFPDFVKYDETSDSLWLYRF